jgi:archaemetzincin
MVAIGLAIGLVAGCRADSSGSAPSPAPTSLVAAAPPVVRGPLGRSRAELAPLRDAIVKLAPLHRRAGTPKEGEWLADHPESGQTFEEYVAGHPITPTEARGALVVQPLGTLGAADERVVADMSRYMEAFFGLPSRLAPPITLDLVGPLARRASRGFGEQLLTTHILEKVLAPRLPDDAMAYVAFTSADLWPADGRNYVFGQASLGDRVGVWSLARNGKASSPTEGRRALVRALKIATHETGHMFGMHHCTAYACNMAGVNGLVESDAHPTWLCPECLAKLAWATGAKPSEHLRRMLVKARAMGMTEEVKHYEASLAALGETAVD